MDLMTILPWIHIGVSFVLIILVLLQAKEEGGWGGSFTGSGDGGGFHVRRGLERVIFIATVATGIIFALLSLVYLFL
jgi:protein translocase SecG subunit